jgi:hypothetical protein
VETNRNPALLEAYGSDVESAMPDLGAVDAASTPYAVAVTLLGRA